MSSKKTATKARIIPELPEYIPGKVEKGQAAQEAPQTGVPNRDPWSFRGSLMHCATCMWYVLKVGIGGTELGRCRKHAPVVLVGYPVVFPTDWCGDYKMDENKV